MIRDLIIAARNLVWAGSPAALSFVSKPREMVNYVTECLFLRRSLNPNGDLDQRTPWEAFGLKDPVPVLIYPEAAKEWFRPTASFAADLVALCALAHIVDPRLVFEIGTLHGSGALHLATNAPRATVYTLDLPPDTSPKLTTTLSDRHHVEEHSSGRVASAGTPEAGRIKCLFGDSATFDFSPFKGKVDLFFIDGAHSYDYVRNDTLKALECCHAGSVIAWHDYGRVGVNGVSRWLHELRASRQIFRVPGGSLAFTVLP
jgi:predicted O-methyltransferase YrrM